ncbi:THO complex subunit 5 homolog [Liolophura sinensis]|uniref:THO complex subunit 5 homolog n=1 Tax=Liolophura sinensis TaxID=3198878 RepID=UPI003158CEAC
MSTKDKEKDKVKRKRAIRSEDRGGSGDNKKSKTDGEDTKVSLFYAEEEEVLNRDPQEDLEMHKAACDEIRRCIADVRKLKSAQGKESAIEEKRIQATLQFIILKKMNRLAHIRCKKVREGTNEAKQKIDQHHLQLENLLYEVTHLQKEITKCLEFKSKDEEIELVPVDKFYREAPKEISKPTETEKNLHKQTLARLDWELEQRKRLSTQLQESENSKEQIENEIREKRDQLESLQPKLRDILQSTKPVQEYLCMPFDKICEQHEIASHLPLPLYVLYMQSSAYKEACDKYLTVTIEGDYQAAKGSNWDNMVLDEDSDSETEEQEKAKSKRRRKTHDERHSTAKDRIFRKHPLFITLEIRCKDGSSLQLSFTYIVMLNIVTVGVKVQAAGDTNLNSISGGDLLSPDSILDDLYPGDHGNNTPNPANHYDLRRVGSTDFSEHICHTGKPYRWAQWLGGLQFLADTEQVKARSTVSASYMQETIRLLRQRLKARLALLKQLISLERYSVPVSSEHQNLFPTKILSQLTSWRRSTYADFISLPYTQTAIDSGLAEEADIFFTAVVDRGSAKLTSQIVLKPDYPSSAPFFLVHVHWKTERTGLTDFHIREVETEVNVHWDELIQGKSHDQLLSNQLQRLLVCFDVYLETEAQNMSFEGPAEIPKEKIFPRMGKGPQRSKPYRYNPQLSFFLHR